MIFHPAMLERLSGFFPSTVTIQEPTEVQDPVTGEVTYTWADVVGMVDLPCSHGPSGGVEVKLPDQTYVVSNYTLALAGNYTGLMRRCGLLWTDRRSTFCSSSTTATG